LLLELPVSPAKRLRAREGPQSEAAYSFADFAGQDRHIQKREKIPNVISWLAMWLHDTTQNTVFEPLY
jgi:hypothetical protein